MGDLYLLQNAAKNKVEIKIPIAERGKPANSIWIGFEINKCINPKKNI